jgi:hypothetical protein
MVGQFPGRKWKPRAHAPEAAEAPVLHLRERANPLAPSERRRSASALTGRTRPADDSRYLLGSYPMSETTQTSAAGPRIQALDSSSNSPAIAIIGTAGRGKYQDPAADRTKLEARGIACFERMVDEASKVIDCITGSGKYRLISGGAAYADHIAVVLFLQRRGGRCEGLTLHLPCPWETTRFRDTGGFDFRTNPGGTSNALHRNFARAMKRDSLAEIRAAILKGARMVVGNGFFDRNSVVASEADYAIALTFGDGARVKDGGTMNTMRTFQKKAGAREKSFHIDLETWQVFSPARV